MEAPPPVRDGVPAVVSERTGAVRAAAVLALAEELPVRGAAAAFPRRVLADITNTEVRSVEA